MAEPATAGTIIDSNVLLDVFTGDPKWAPWSEEQLVAAFDRGPVIINAMIFAEVSIRFERIEELEEALPPEIAREALPWEAGFLAGRCFVAYRRRGGRKTSPLPGFFIGAHAAVTARALLTRDPKRYETHFPRLVLVAP